MVITKDNTIHNVEIHNGVTYNTSILPGVIVAYYYTNSPNERIQLYSNDGSVVNAVFNGAVTGAYYTFPTSGSHRVVINLKNNTFNPAIFKNNIYVRTINIGKNITNILPKTGNTNDGYWFTRATVEAGNPVYHSIGSAVIETSSNKLVLGGAESTIDSSVTTLGSYAFAYVKNSNSVSPGTSTYWSITIPDTVREIEDYCFDDCKKLHRINLYGRPVLSQYALKYLLGDNTSELHIKVGTSIAGTLWYDDLIYDRGWILCVDL